MADTTCRSGFVRALGREIGDPDANAEELGQAVLVLEMLVDAGVVDVEAADFLLRSRLAGPRG